MAKLLSDVKVRAEIWFQPKDNRRAQRAARANRKTRAGWMRDVILRELDKEEARRAARASSLASQQETAL